MDCSEDPLLVVKSYELGNIECVGVETSTHTYICEGYGAHNSVAEHSVNVMTLGSRHRGTYSDNGRRALALLLHDAAEAYLGDVVSPLKYMLAPQYQELEHRWLRAIELKFNIDDLLTEPEPLVKQCDLRALSIEIENLCSPVHPDWWTKFEKPTIAELHQLDIECLSPSQARRKFLDSFKKARA